ncbi:transposase, partial [Parasutterella secunda]|uniref:transposase n=1 Tax=Parasutterella secunda TaxID=626947 RepID=UPI0025A40328
MLEIIFDRNCVYQTAYHAVWCPKYRKSILVGSIAAETKRLIEMICQERQWP